MGRPRRLVRPARAVQPVLASHDLPGALAGMLGGAITVVVWHNLIKPLGGVFGIYELLPAFIISLACIFVVSKLTAEPLQEIYDEFDHYTEARMDEDVNPTAA